MQCFILSHLVFFTEHCISDVGYTDDGEECSTSCGLEHGGLSKLHNWCWTVNATLESDWCTPTSKCY